MMKLNSLLIILTAMLTLSCTMSAKNDAEANEAGIASGTNTTAPGEVVVLDKADFLTKVFNYEKNMDEWVYEGTKPCIIDFYADWCGPCKKIAPVLKDLAKEYANDLIVYKIDVDKEKELAAAFGIQSIPTLLFVPSEGVPMLSMGALSKEQFEQQIKEFLLVQQ